MKSRLHFLHLGFQDFRQPGSGGGAVRTHEINKRIAKSHDVTVITSSYKGAVDRTEDGVRYIHIGKSWGYFGSVLTYFAALPFVVHKIKTDLVVEDFAAPFSSCLSPLWTRRPYVAVVQWLNAWEKSRQYRVPFWITEKLGLILHKRYIAVSSDLADKIRSRSKKAEVTVIGNGTSESTLQVRLGQSRKDIVFLGRLEREQKGVDILLDAYALIAPSTKAKLIIAGDGPDESWVRNRIAELGLKSRVRLVGRVEGKMKDQMLARARVVVMPSRFETFGMVAIEALAAGAPVVAFAIPCLRQVIPKGLGKLVRAFDTDALGGAILYYCQARASLATERRRRHFAARYDWNKLAVKQLNAYKKAIAATHSQPRVKLKLAYMVATAMAVTLIVRLMAVTMYDIHIDEITYARYAQTILAGHLPLNYDNSPFFLHPPGYLVVLALWTKLVMHSQDIFALLTDLRYLNILMATLTAGMVVVLAWMTTRKIYLTLIAGLLFALDSFGMRHNVRGLIETQSMLLLLISLWLAFKVLQHKNPRWYHWGIVGLTCGLAIVTKDIAGVFLVLTALLVIACKVGPRLRAYAITGVAAVFPYALWIGIVIRSGNWPAFVAEKTSGIQRFVGLLQTTGFNAEGAPSKGSTLLATVPHYASAYLIIGLGTIGLWLLLRSTNTLRRLWGCVAAGSVLTVAYLMFSGTFEEQFLYYLFVPNIITVLLIGIELWPMLSTRIYRAAQIIMATMLVAILLFDITAFSRNMRSPDNGWETTVRWIDDNVPGGSTICIFDQGQFLFAGRDYVICNWHSQTDLKTYGAQYIVVVDKLVQSNYASVTVADLHDIETAAVPVFNYASRDSGVFTVYQLR